MTCIAPDPWDGESYCAQCQSWPAIVSEPVGMVGDSMLVELLCVSCATARQEARRG
jgi:hypothetical protein